MDRVEKARTVSNRQIAVELGWSKQKAKRRLEGHLNWLVSRFRKPNGHYDAQVIEVLRALYSEIAGEASKNERDFLAQYLKEIKHG